MMSKLEESKSIKTNLLYAFGAQGIGLIVSAFMSFVVPKLLGVEEFACWQTFLLYAGYSGCLLFGINDGIYLRIGGKSYDSLNQGAIKAQFLVVLAAECLFALLIVLGGIVAGLQGYFLFITVVLGFYTVAVNIANYLSYIFQAVNLTQIFSKAAALTKVLFFAMLVFALAFGFRSFQLIVLAYLASQSISTVYLIYMSRKTLCIPMELVNIKSAFRDISADISSGMKVMLSYYSGIFIIGFGRMLIEPNWDLSTFGYYSFATSLISFVLSFAGQAAMVLFPHIKRAGLDRKLKNYLQVRSALVVLMPVAYVLYFPCVELCEFWLPDYIPAVGYLGLLFPICVFNCKMSMLCTPYMKALRKENLLLGVNVLAMFVSVVLSCIAVYMLHSLNALALGMTLAIALRSYISEVVLGREFGVSTIFVFAREVCLAACFEIVLVLSSPESLALGSVVLFAYYALSRKELGVLLRLRKG